MRLILSALLLISGAVGTNVVNKSSNCNDSTSMFKWINQLAVSCEWVAENKDKGTCSYSVSIKNCPLTCDQCSVPFDHESTVSPRTQRISDKIPEIPYVYHRQLQTTSHSMSMKYSRSRQPTHINIVNPSAYNEKCPTIHISMVTVTFESTMSLTNIPFPRTSNETITLASLLTVAIDCILLPGSTVTIEKLGIISSTSILVDYKTSISATCNGHQQCLDEGNNIYSKAHEAISNAFISGTFLQNLSKSFSKQMNIIVDPQLWTVHEPVIVVNTLTYPTSCLELPTLTPSVSRSVLSSRPNLSHLSMKPTNRFFSSFQPSMAPETLSQSPTSSPPTIPLPTKPFTASTSRPTSTSIMKKSAEPTDRDTAQSTKKPSTERFSIPTIQPMINMSYGLTNHPIAKLTMKPTTEETLLLTSGSTMKPLTAILNRPSLIPTSKPTIKLTSHQTSAQPAVKQSLELTTSPTPNPTSKKQSAAPTDRFIVNATEKPSTVHLVTKPSVVTTSQPIAKQTVRPTRGISFHFTPDPTIKPSTTLTIRPLSNPMIIPSTKPTSRPIQARPSTEPSIESSSSPTSDPTAKKSTEPTNRSTAKPSGKLSTERFSRPTFRPTTKPSFEITNHNIAKQTERPTRNTSSLATSNLTMKPKSTFTNRPLSSQPVEPSIKPLATSAQPQSTTKPSIKPADRLATYPTAMPLETSAQPTVEPVTRPTAITIVKSSTNSTSRPSYAAASSLKPTIFLIMEHSKGPSQELTVMPTMRSTTANWMDNTARPASVITSRTPSISPTVKISVHPISKPATISPGNLTPRPTIASIVNITFESTIQLSNIPNPQSTIEANKIASILKTSIESISLPGSVITITQVGTVPIKYLRALVTTSSPSTPVIFNTSISTPCTGIMSCQESGDHLFNNSSSALSQALTTGALVKEIVSTATKQKESSLASVTIAPDALVISPPAQTITRPSIVSSATTGSTHGSDDKRSMYFISFIVLLVGVILIVYKRRKKYIETSSNVKVYHDLLEEVEAISVEYPSSIDSKSSTSPSKSINQGFVLRPFTYVDPEDVAEYNKIKSKYIQRSIDIKLNDDMIEGNEVMSPRFPSPLDVKSIISPTGSINKRFVLRPFTYFDPVDVADFLNPENSSRNSKQGAHSREKSGASYLGVNSKVNDEQRSNHFPIVASSQRNYHFDMSNEVGESELNPLPALTAYPSYNSSTRFIPNHSQHRGLEHMLNVPGDQINDLYDVYDANSNADILNDSFQVEASILNWTDEICHSPGRKRTYEFPDTVLL